MTWELLLPALIAAVVATIPAVLAYRRSRHVDAVSEASGVASDNREGVAQVVASLRELADQFQEDNRDLRNEMRQLEATQRDELRHQVTRLEACFAERDALKRELARLRRRYGEKDPDTPPHGNPTMGG